MPVERGEGRAATESNSKNYLHWWVEEATFCATQVSLFNQHAPRYSLPLDKITPLVLLGDIPHPPQKWLGPLSLTFAGPLDITNTRSRWS